MAFDPSDINAALVALSKTLGQANLQEKIREFNQTFGLQVGDLTGLYNNNATLNALNQAGFSYGPGGVSTPTLTAMQNAAAESGMIAAGTPGVASNLYNTPTIGTQALTGYLNLPGQGFVPTTAEQGVQLQAQQNALGAINNILQSNSSPANPFTYLSKLQGIANLGPTAAILRGALTGATGQTPGQLSQQPTVLNSTIMSNLYGSMLNNPGVPQDNTLGTILGTAQSQNIPVGSASSKVDINGLLNNLVNGLSNSVPGHVANGLATGLGNSAPASMLNSFNQSNSTPAIPTGFSTGSQSLNKLSPSLQGAYQNLIQQSGGENPTDFAAGVKLAGPEFQRAGSGSISSFGNL